MGFDGYGWWIQLVEEVDGTLTTQQALTSQQSLYKESNDESEIPNWEELELAEITEVRIYKAKTEGAVKAYASISLDNEFVVKGIKVLEGENGLWVSMPSRKGRDGTFQDIFHPASREAREKIVNAVLEAYREQI